MNDESGITNSEFELELVEIHPEMYSNNLFGEAPAEAGGHSVSTQLQTMSIDKAAFNIFSLTDAVGARNKREAWVLYRKALASGMAPEEVFYKVVWQVKTLLLAAKTKSAEEAEMKSFPYGKAKGFIRNFKGDELEKISENLVCGYHRARMGKGEVETLVERVILSL